MTSLPPKCKNRPAGVPRVSAGPSAGGGHLSKGHSATPPLNGPGVTFWKGSNAAQIRGATHWRDAYFDQAERLPESSPDDPDLFETAYEDEKAKRGMVTEFTGPARRRFMRDMSKVKRETDARTMCLTCPGDDPGADAFYEGFRRFKRWMSVRIKEVGCHWKMEPQKRGAMHAHLLLYIPEGMTVDGEEALQGAMARKWHELIGGGDEKHLWWHLRPQNWQRARGGIAWYFAKYLGKEADAEGVQAKGHWWGRINKASIPYGEEVYFEFPSEKVEKKAVRAARKFRQRKAELAAEAGFNRALFGDVPGMAPFPYWKASGNARVREASAVIDCLAAQRGLLRVRPRLPKFGAVFLVGRHAQNTLARVVLWAGVEAGLQPAPPSGFLEFAKGDHPPNQSGEAG